MKKALLIFFLFPTILHAQSFDSIIDEQIQKINQDSIHKYLQEFEDLGIKGIGTNSLNNTAVWLENYFSKWGYTSKRDTFNYLGYQLYNIIIDKKGTVDPTKYFIIDGHYDTKNGPGTNDNGSGISIILEIARILKDIDTDYSIRFICFSGEEDGLYGSTHYVTKSLKEKNTDIVLLLNIDEVGGVNGLVNNTIKCERDESYPTLANAKSYAYTDTLANLTETYTSLTATITNAYNSDYIPFQNKEYVITGYFEANETPHRHTISDSLLYVDITYVTEVAKGALAASIYFSRNIGLTGIKNIDFVNNYQIIKTNNILTINNLNTNELSKTTIHSILGNILFSKEYKNSIEIDLSIFTKGVYMLTIENNEQRSSIKILVE